MSQGGSSGFNLLDTHIGCNVEVAKATLEWCLESRTMLAHVSSEYRAVGSRLGLRWIQDQDLDVISRFGTSADEAGLRRVYAETGFRSDEHGAAGIVTLADSRLIGTMQYFKAGPTIHGLEFAYAIYEASDRGCGFGAEALELLSALTFRERSDCARQQLVIEISNIASWKIAERSGFLREGLLRASGPTNQGDNYLYSRTRADWGRQRVDKSRKLSRTSPHVRSV